MLNNFITIGALFAAVANASLIYNQPRDGVIALDLVLPTNDHLEKRQIGETDYFLKGKNFPKAVVQVGSNKDPVLLVVDTGSWGVQVPDVSSNCSTCLLPNGEVGLYNSSKSTTIERTGEPFRIKFYSDAYYYGEGVIDDIWLDSNFKIPEVLLNDVNDIGKGWPFGLLGLAKPPKGSEYQNVVLAAYNAGSISKPIASLHSRNSSGTSLQLFLGGYSKAQTIEPFTWNSIRDTNVHAYIDSININGTDIPVNSNATFDTGNDLILVHKDVYSGILNALPDDPNNAKGSKKIDYSLIKDKTFTITFFGKNYTIPLIAFIEPDCQDQHCALTVVSTTAYNIGSPLLRFINLAIDYEVGNEKIGLASWKPSNTNEVVAF
ncbi:hypothetical protein KGF54_003542 [Candida jiufengensis]|uniref:uncharacterized protein n=1 Tax=Candida jiufengensis TaxID=497108 RepID=UPI00222523D4|nr:uncharacterized protein KGF54_003542 [Candida jiufengensis]KAI5952675.1 hypothetical protein KGF54_003542 [Candida jiufengensis]